MTLSITKEQLIAMQPCNAENHLALFGRKKSMNSKQALGAGATIRNLLWVANRMGRKDLCVKFALVCAQRVSHFSSDPRTQKALHATQNWLDNPTEENKKLCRIAAYYADANAAVYAAYAAYATYAVAVVDSAAAAVDAAAYAVADANGADARQTEIDEQKRIFIEIFS